MERETLKLSAKEGREIIYQESDNFEIIQDNITGNGRWTIDHSIIVKRLSDGKFFESEYSKGATEAQDERPYEYGDAIFNEVFPVEKTITVYN